MTIHSIPTHTLQRFITTQARKHAHTTGELSDLLSSIVLGVKIISSLVATAGFKGLQGYTGSTNVQGEATKMLDEEADRTLIEVLGASGHFGLMVSEEQDKVVQVGETACEGKYVVAFDPLDGSSNIGSNIPVGTIFSILRRTTSGCTLCPDDFLQSGRNVVAAGYAVYGAKTSFVYSSGAGVHGFTLDPSIGEFVLTEELIKTPARGHVYSVNEGRSYDWPPQMTAFVEQLKKKGDDNGIPYSARYVGSLVSDFDRNLRNGGIFLYPSDKKNPKGKLRLLYECIPLAFIQEQAGGKATDGTIAMLDKQPQDIHERTPFFSGSVHEMEWFERLKGK